MPARPAPGTMRAMNRSDSLPVVRSWLRAFDQRDLDHLFALTARDLEYHRWLGVEHGHDALRGLLHRHSYGVTLRQTMRRGFRRGPVVVAELHLESRFAETGEPAGVQDAAAVFEVRDGRVASIRPCPDLVTALRAAGLSERDVVDLPDPPAPLVVAVLGASGGQGAPVARRLLREGHRVRAVARRPERGPAGCKPVAADLTDAVALESACAGADAVVIHLPLVFGDRALVMAERVAAAVRRADVPRVVISTGGPLPPGPIGMPYVDARVELVRALDGAAVVEPFGAYMENLAAPWSAPLVREGVLAYPLPAERPMPWLALADVAERIAAALADGETGRIPMAGPWPLTGEQAAEALGRGAGRPVHWRSLEPAEYGDLLRPHLGDEAADGVADMYAALAAGPAPAPDPARLRVGSSDLESWARAQHWTAARAREAVR